MVDMCIQYTKYVVTIILLGVDGQDVYMQRVCLWVGGVYKCHECSVCVSVV